MSVLLEKRDIINVAIRIEENGERFYTETSKKAKTGEVRELLSFLAREESRHKEVFSDILNKANLSNENLSDEYLSYLKAYTDRLIFNTETDEFNKGDIDQIRVLDFAIQRELDSILYYHEIKAIVPHSEHPLIDKIISEERSHFEKLSRIKDILTKR